MTPWVTPQVENIKSGNIMKEKFINPNKFGVMNVISAINGLMGSFEGKVLRLKPVLCQDYPSVYYLKYFNDETYFSGKLDTSAWKTVHYTVLSEYQVYTILKMLVNREFEIVSHREHEVCEVKVWNNRLGQYVPGHKVNLSDYFYWHDVYESRPLIKKLISHVIEHGTLKSKGDKSKDKFAIEVRWREIELPKPMMVRWFNGGSNGWLVKTKISGIYCTVDDMGEYNGFMVLDRVDKMNPISVYPNCNVNDIIRLMKSIGISFEK